MSTVSSHYFMISQKYGIKVLSQTNYFVPLPAYYGKMEFVNIQPIKNL